MISEDPRVQTDQHPGASHRPQGPRFLYYRVLDVITCHPRHGWESAPRVQGLTRMCLNGCLKVLKFFFFSEFFHFKNISFIQKKNSKQYFSTSAVPVAIYMKSRERKWRRGRDKKRLKGKLRLGWIGVLRRSQTSTSVSLAFPGDEIKSVSNGLVSSRSETMVFSPGDNKIWIEHGG